MGRLLPFVAAAFLGAGLLFSVEPLIGKLVLPLLGGVPAVWNTCLLFFQGMLLAGYAYAHFGTRLLGVRRHAVLHIIIVAASLLLLPPSVAAVEAPVTGSPVPWLLLVLLRAVGLPFFVLSATAPLVQRWFADSRHTAARDPYFLYAASNLGSLVGLVLYPFVLEPFTGLSLQSAGWSAVYALFALLIAALAVIARRVGRSWSPADADMVEAPAAPDSARLAAAAAPGRAGVTAVDAARWTAVAFLPSALLLTVTGYVTTDVAPMPLLWLLPLALYLVTFIVAFGTREDTKLRAALGHARLPQPVLTVIVAGAVVAGYNPAWMLPLHLAALTLVGLLAHGRLALERPHASQLTAFYLWISVGGTLGGVFGAIVAPLLLMPEPEYALLLVVALLLPGRATARAVSRRAMLATAGAIVALAAATLATGRAAAGLALIGAAATSLLIRIDRHRVGIAAAIALFITGVAATGPRGGGEELASDRNFFGTLRVREVDGYRRLVHGRTVHGAQSIEPGAEHTPTTYYAREGPLGDVFSLLRKAEAARVGVVGMGAGTAVCLGERGMEWDLFEIDPAVVDMARDPRLFSFIASCAPDATVIIGDGRRSLEQLDDARYDLLILDAFSSDAIPAHLLTGEAFALYAARLAHGGVLAVHISNRHLDLRPVVAANAIPAGLEAWLRQDSVRPHMARLPSRWVALAADAGTLQPLHAMRDWTRLEPSPGFRRWTDDYTSLIPVLRLRP